MELRDLIVTPVIILLIYIIAYLIRPMWTNETTRRYFFPALTLKLFGALSVGLIYQFYYDGGDTYNYHTHGSRIIWEELIENPLDGIKLFFNSHDASLYPYYSKIDFYFDSSSFFIGNSKSVRKI